MTFRDVFMMCVLRDQVPYKGITLTRASFPTLEVVPVGALTTL